MGSSGRSPYTDDDEAYTTRRTPARRAASSTFNVPVTLWSLAPSGSATERGTERMAAWWKIVPAPATVALDEGEVANVPAHDLQAVARGRGERQVVEAAGREVVEDPDARLRVIAQQPLGQVRTDEPASAGDHEHG